MLQKPVKIYLETQKWEVQNPTTVFAGIPVHLIPTFGGLALCLCIDRRTSLINYQHSTDTFGHIRIRAVS